jgi:hypothetical protein
MPHHYGLTFLELIRAPFTDVNMVWGIVPLYFGLMLNELTSTKANFRTAIQTGFSFLWAAAQWAYLYVKWHSAASVSAVATSTRSINLMVTVLVFLVGLLALEVIGNRDGFVVNTRP